MIAEDRDIFEQCTDTIIRQVGDVTRMVDEFSAFARMPKPQMEEHDIRDVVRASVLDRQMGNGEIAFDKRLGDDPVLVSCDRRLIAQAIHNLVKNAEEAIQQYAESPDKEAGLARPHRDGRAPQRQPRRHRSDRQRSGPAQAQPQAPARALRDDQGPDKGTGLGLAIVQKSVEQHGGSAGARGRAGSTRPQPRRADPHHAAGEPDARRADIAANSLNPPPPTAAHDCQRAEGATDGI